MPVLIGRAEPGFDDPVGLLTACHRRIERFLAVLVDLAARRNGHSLSAEESLAMEVALRYFRDAAPHHTADEERGLFPALKQAAGRTPSELPDLERDHRRAEELHSTVDKLGRIWLQEGMLDPFYARELQTTLASLSALYREHIAIEEKRLFPQAQQTLSPDVLESIGRDMAARRGVTYIPPGAELTTSVSRGLS